MHIKSEQSFGASYLIQWLYSDGSTVTFKSKCHSPTFWKIFLTFNSMPILISMVQFRCENYCQFLLAYNFTILLVFKYAIAVWQMNELLCWKRLPVIFFFFFFKDQFAIKTTLSDEEYSEDIKLVSGKVLCFTTAYVKSHFTELVLKKPSKFTVSDINVPCATLRSYPFAQLIVLSINVLACIKW